MKRGARGFTLIEAIVAMVLVATTGMAIFTWINSNLIALNRVQDINTENAATLNIVEYMQQVNPMQTPEGKAELGSYRIVWQSTAVTEPQDGANYPVGIGLYQFALFKTRINVQKRNNSAWFSFDLQQVGYKKVREIAPPPI